MYWKHSANFIVYGLVALWCFIMIKYLEYTKDHCTLNKNNEKFRKTSYIITWIIFVLSCLGGLMALLEMVGVLHAEYRLRLV